MSELGKTGQQIWSAFNASALDGATQTLVRELARTADSLDGLDQLVKGNREAWAVLVFDDMGTVHLSVDKLLDARAKQQAIYKQLWAELRGWGVKPQAGSGMETPADEEPVDVLAMRRKEKEERERNHG